MRTNPVPQFPPVLAFALVAAACADPAAPTAPDDARAQATAGAHAAITAAAKPVKPSRKDSYISSLTIGNQLRIVPGGSSPYTMTITNPGTKTQSEIYVQATLVQGGVIYGAGGTISGCPEFSGQVPPGDCAVNHYYVASPSIGLGAATLEIELLLYNRTTDRTSVLDRRRVDVTVDPVFQ